MGKPTLCDLKKIGHPAGINNMHHKLKIDKSKLEINKIFAGLKTTNSILNK